MPVDDWCNIGDIIPGQYLLENICQLANLIFNISSLWLIRTHLISHQSIVFVVNLSSCVLHVLQPVSDWCINRSGCYVRHSCAVCYSTHMELVPKNWSTHTWLPNYSQIFCILLWLCGQWHICCHSWCINLVGILLQGIQYQVWIELAEVLSLIVVTHFSFFLKMASIINSLIVSCMDTYYCCLNWCTVLAFPLSV